MSSKARYRWTLLGTFAATAALVGPGCNRDKPMMPREGSRYEGVANTQQPGTPAEPMAAPPATGGSGQQGADVPKDNKGMPLQPEPAGAQGQTNKIGAPGFTTPNEPVPGDQGGLRRFEEGNSTGEAGPASPAHPSGTQGAGTPEQQ